MVNVETFLAVSVQVPEFKKWKTYCSLLEKRMHGWNAFFQLGTPPPPLPT